jgi:cytochrome c oxidase assembly protein subunit 15
VGAWLLVMWLLVLLMIMVGGVTRLTGSGLSIVEWAPVSGALPPRGDRAWQEAFGAYQQSPQFQQQNHWMQLSDFKRIFFWEYLHRLLGRVIGLAFFLPWLVFLWRKTLRGALVWRTFALLILGGLQGVLGWYMVMSGLVNEPRVSHYRLAAHLLLGVSVGLCILWQALEVATPREPAYALARRTRWLVTAAIPLLLLQLFYGALMAGTRAGHVSATFPDMNGHYSPSSFFTGVWARDLFDNPLSIHYLHRALACVVLAHAIAAAIAVRNATLEQRATAYLYLGAVVAQGALGALTVVLHMPIPVAVAHQGGAYIVCSSAILLCHAAWGARSSSTAPAAASSGADGGDDSEATWAVGR